MSTPPPQVSVNRVNALLGTTEERVSVTASNVSLTGLFTYQTRLIPLLDGSSAARAAPSAKFIQDTYNIRTNGSYWINLPTVGATLLYCILDPTCAGGGWMMALKGTRGSTFDYSANYWTTTNTLNTSAANRNDGDAKFDAYNYYPATDWLAIFPDVSSGGDVVGGYGGWTWLENNAINNTLPLVQFYGTHNIQYTKASNGVGYPLTDIQPRSLIKWNGSIFSHQLGFQWYGIHYKTATNTYARWGFSFNNEADQLSNDVVCGIGLRLANTAYSAGDLAPCCAAAYGVNRTMRFEWYVR